MDNSIRLLGAALAVCATVLTTTACTAPYQSTQSSPSCSELLDGVITYVRSGTGNIDSTMQTLSDSCRDEYDIAVDYVSNSTDSALSIDSCDQLLDYGIREESVALLEQDRRCSFDDDEVILTTEWPDSGLGWDRAREHAGTVQRVCGPLRSLRITDDGTFVNVGQDYPSADRFTFIFWDFYLDPIEPGATICGRGEIYLYNGVAQMEMWDPGALEIWR